MLMFLFCQKVQHSGYEYNAAKAILFLTNQVADITDIQ